jgi:hypothetical protein
MPIIFYIVKARLVSFRYRLMYFVQLEVPSTKYNFKGRISIGRNSS